MTAIQSPTTISSLASMVAKHGKKAYFVSSIDPTSDKIPGGRVAIEIGGVAAINKIETSKDKVIIGTGLNLGRLAREATGEHGLLRQATSLIASPLVRNRVTFLEAINPESPYFDVTTPLVLLDAKVRLQSLTGKRSISIREYLESTENGLKKGEIAVQIAFERLSPGELVGFFRVARTGGKGSVSAAARMKIVRNVCKDPEIVVSSLSLIPLRIKSAEKEIANQSASEVSIKRASVLAATELLQLAESRDNYERSLIEIAVARTLRTIMDGSIPA